MTSVFKVRRSSWLLKRGFLLAGLLALFLLNLAHAAQIDGVRLWRAPDNTRIVFDLSAPVEHKLFTLQGPARVVIDIDGAHLASGVGELSLKDTPVADVRYGKRNQSDLRVVLDLAASVQARSFILPKHGGKPDRLVVDLYDKETAPARRSEPTQGLSDLIPDKRDIVILIDPGHGGEDPGALGPNGIREKDVVFSISEMLVELINREPGYQAQMARTGDYYVPLRARRDRARALRADLFVSVHADAFKNPQANGASVYALSRRGATSESARFLATKENEADLIGGVGGVSLRNVDDVLAGVLVDLSMNATLSKSLDVGAQVLKELGKVARLHKSSVEQAGFAVLKSPDVPSILVETGFISNPQEAQKLGTQSYRRFLANAIFNGLIAYFEESPPTGSYLAWRQNNPEAEREYVISRGDTLSGIAQRYNISLQKLLEHNNLQSGSVIRVGQRLMIPTG